MNRIAFVQPFGVDAPGGGARILRSLARRSPVEIVSIVSSPKRPAICETIQEFHLPYRPYFHRLEHTRFHRFFDLANERLIRRYSSNLAALCQKLKVSAIHSIAHWWDCVAAREAAKQLKIPFFLSVHDDIRYTAAGDSRLCEHIGSLWRDAKGRYSISPELGEEYNSRYGTRAFTLVTDGLERWADFPQVVNHSRLRLYFMGLFHIAYSDNFRALFSALQKHRQPGVEITLRCGVIPKLAIPSKIPVRVLPFTTCEEILAQDIAGSDLLYLPLPFEPEFSAFSKFSLSTKLVTYLSSGVPILYHGPPASALARLLEKHKAATLVMEPGAEAIQAALQKQPQCNQQAAANALQVAKSEFCLADIAQRFWSDMTDGLSS